MANLNTLFWVRASQINKKGLAPLMIRITIPIKDVADFSSGKMVDPKLWNADRKQVNGRSGAAEQINKYIVSSAAKIQKVYDELEREERPISAEVVKNIFLGKNQAKMTMLSALAEHNEAFKTKIEREGKLSPHTLKKFEQLNVKLVDFMHHKYNRKDVFITEVNFGFIEDFRTWLHQYGHHREGGLSADSATGHLKKLHKIILRLFKRGLIKVDPFLDIDLKWEDPTAEALSEDQLEKLENLQLHSPRLQRVLDRFIVGCYSGLSNADISKVGPDDIIKNFVDDSLWLKLRRTKTDTVCKIPLLPPVLAIIEKYKDDPKCIKENKLFPVVSLNTCNELLKDIAVIANLEVNLHTHVSRHVFCQMCMDLGVNIEAISQIVGHSSSRTTKAIYAKASHKFVSHEIKNLTDKKFPHLKVVDQTSTAR